MASNFVEDANALWQETEEWKKTWKHKKPCKEWKENEKQDGVGFCKHYVEARYRKFKKRIEPLFTLEVTYSLDSLRRKRSRRLTPKSLGLLEV